jgi:hypothetical protein
MSGSNEALLKLVEEMRVKVEAMKPKQYVVAPDVYNNLLRERQDKAAEAMLDGVKVVINSFLPPGTVVEMDGKPVGLIPGGNEFKMDPLSQRLFTSPDPNHLARVVYQTPDPEGPREKLPRAMFLPECEARLHDDASVPLPDPEPLVEIKPKPPRDNTGWSQFTANEIPPAEDGPIQVIPKPDPKQTAEPKHLEE